MSRTASLAFLLAFTVSTAASSELALEEKTAFDGLQFSTDNDELARQLGLLFFSNPNPGVRLDGEIRRQLEDWPVVAGPDGELNRWRYQSALQSRACFLAEEIFLEGFLKKNPDFAPIAARRSLREHWRINYASRYTDNHSVCMAFAELKLTQNTISRVLPPKAFNNDHFGKPPRADNRPIDIYRLRDGFIIELGALAVEGNPSAATAMALLSSQWPEVFGLSPVASYFYAAWADYLWGQLDDEPWEVSTFSKAHAVFSKEENAKLRATLAQGLPTEVKARADILSEDENQARALLDQFDFSVFDDID